MTRTLALMCIGPALTATPAAAQKVATASGGRTEVDKALVSMKANDVAQVRGTFRR